MGAAPYNRILLKVSGEALQGTAAYGIDAATVRGIATQIKAASDLGVQIAVVVGGGNIWRGASDRGESIGRGRVVWTRAVRVHVI